MGEDEKTEKPTLESARVSLKPERSRIWRRPRTDIWDGMEAMALLDKCSSFKVIRRRTPSGISFSPLPERSNTKGKQLLATRGFHVTMVLLTGKRGERSRRRKSPRRKSIIG
jgi:hypothetical protein